MLMSWVRRFLKTLLLDTPTTIGLTGGYEFLMENCTSIGNYSAHVRTASLTYGARSCKG